MSKTAITRSYFARGPYRKQIPSLVPCGRVKFGARSGREAAENAKRLTQNGTAERRLRLYRYALRSLNFSADVHWRCAWTFMDLDRYVEALPHLERACQLVQSMIADYANRALDTDPPHLISSRQDLLHFNNDRGYCLYRLHRYEEAITALHEAQGNCGPTTAYLYLAHCYRELGQYEGAAKNYHTCTRRNSRKAFGYVGLGDALLHLGQPIKALKAFDRALLLEPANATAMAGSLDCLVALGRIDEARCRAIALLDHEGQAPEYYIHLSDVFGALGMPDKLIESNRLASCAVKDAQQRQFPIAEEGALMVQRVKRASLYRKARKATRCRRCTTEVVRIKPDPRKDYPCIHIMYQLDEGGWGTLVITDNRTNYVSRTSSWFDPLVDFANFGIQVCERGEPGEVQWTDDHILRIVSATFEQQCLQLRLRVEPGQPHNDIPRDTTPRYWMCTRDQLLLAIVNMLGAVLWQYGYAGYRERWAGDEPFPLRQYKRLWELASKIERGEFDDLQPLTPFVQVTTADVRNERKVAKSL